MQANTQKNNSFIKQAGILAIAGIISRIIGLLYRSPLEKIIGDEGNGYYGNAYVVYNMILLIASYSIPSAISKEISQRLAMGQKKNADRVFKCAMAYAFIVGGVASIVSYVCADLFFVGHNAPLVFRFFAPTIFFSGILGVMRGYFQARRTMTLTSVSQIIEQIINAVMSIGMAYVLMTYIAPKDSTSQAVYGAIGSSIGTGSGVLIALIFMSIFVIRNYRKENICSCTDIRNYRKENINSDIDNKEEIMPYKSIFKQTMVTITPIIFSTCIYNSTPVINQTIFTNIMQLYRGITEKTSATLYGIYSGKAVVITNIPIAIASAVAASMMPNVAAHYIKGELKETRKSLDKAISATMLIAIPSTVAFLFVAKPIIQTLFYQKESYELASHVLMSLSISVIFYSLSTITNSVLQAIGKANIPVRNAVIALVIQTVVVSVLVLTLSKDGVSSGVVLHSFTIASVVYSFAMCMLNGLAIKKYIGYKQNFKKFYLIPAAVALFMGVVVRLVYNIIYGMCGMNKVAFFISAIIGVMVYALALIKLGIIKKSDLKLT